MSNIEFYCSSLLTCFQTYLTIDNFESNLIYLNESSLMNIVDSTLEINHVLFERIWKSECYCGVFDLIGSSFLCINDIVLNNLSFTYKEPYDFNSGQVSIGGVSYNNLDEYNFSILEKNVGFAGEILDSDGLCGGYNLMFCIASSQLIANQILKLIKI